MSKATDGGPAFPYDVQRNGRGHHDGMSLRDYFAIHASENDLIAFMQFGDSVLHKRARTSARYAYADAMIAERSKEG